MKLKKLFIFLVVVSMLITTGCITDGVSPAPVQPPPERITLGSFEPVVVLDITVENDVWDVKSVTVQFGTATESIVLERDVLVEIQNEKGETLHRFSKKDPRIVYFEEAPEFSSIKKLPTGKILVSLPYSPEIQNVRLAGQSPELKDLRKSFDIGDEVKQAYEKFEAQIKMNPQEIPVSTVPVRPEVLPLKVFTLAIYASEGGTTEPPQGKYEFKEGAQLVVTAKPDLNWRFMGWEGAISSDSTQITITMDSDKTVTASFTKFYSYSTQLIIARSGIKTIEDLNDGKVCVIGEASWDCAVVAQKVHGVAFTRVTVSPSEIYEALQEGLIDAVLVAGHPSKFVPEDVNVLPWGDDAIQAVIKAFPNMVATVLPAKTYYGQENDIYGYADKNKL